MIEETIPGMLIVLDRASNAPAAAVQAAVAQAAATSTNRPNPIDGLIKLGWVFRQLRRLLNAQYPSFGSGNAGTPQHRTHVLVPVYVACHSRPFCGAGVGGVAGSGEGFESHARKEPRRSRSAELIGLAAVDICLGVSSSINCKSGCDRSGIVHALTTAIHLRYACSARQMLCNLHASRERVPASLPVIVCLLECLAGQNREGRHNCRAWSGTSVRHISTNRAPRW